jgi:hypothetical protein
MPVQGCGAISKMPNATSANVRVQPVADSVAGCEFRLRKAEHQQMIVKVWKQLAVYALISAASFSGGYYYHVERTKNLLRAQPCFAQAWIPELGEVGRVLLPPDLC